MANAYHYQHSFDDGLAAEFKGILSQGFDPRHIPSIETWLDANKDYPVRIAGGLKVLQWRDKAKFQRDALQSINISRPIYSISEPSISFNNSYLDWSTFDDTQILNSNQITLALRIKLYSTPATSPQAIISKGSYNTTHIYLDLFQTTLRFKLGNSILFTHDITNYLGNWVTILLKASNGILSLKIDDVVIASALSYGNIITNYDPLLIGARTVSGSPSQFLSDCKIKHIIIFSTQLADNEIAQLTQTIT